MIDLNIINGKIFHENRLIEAGISIQDGKIVAIDNSTSLPNSNQTINAINRIILPGGIDVHTHILDLIFSYREDFVTGSQAAAAGGITTYLEMPLGIEGKTVLEVFDTQLDEMKRKSLVDYGLIGSAGHNTIDTISKQAQKGAIAFKTFMINPSEETAELKNLAAKNDYYLLKIFTEIAKTGLISSIHAENDLIITHEINRLLAENKKDFQAHTDSRPAISEDEACLRAIFLAHESNVKLNLVHMSSKGAFEIIRTAKMRGCNVSCEITPHHLFLSSKDGEKIGPWAKVDPPLRSEDHVSAAWKALNDGTIDMIASDHSPYSDSEKDLNSNNNSFFEIGSGTTGIETILPMMIHAVNEKMTTLERVVATTSTNPAKRFGLFPRKGVIALNSDADLVIVNMKEKYTLRNQDLFTQPKITIFDGKTLRGKIEKTLVRGKVVFDNGDFLVEKGYGEFITPAIHS